MKNTRKVYSTQTISNSRLHPIYQKSKLIPQIKLQGIYLEQAGFSIGREYQIEVKDNSITLYIPKI